MKKYVLFAAPLIGLVLSGCGSSFYGPPRLARLSHIDGSVGTPNFQCDASGAFSPNRNSAGTGRGSQETIQQFNLSWKFSSKVCKSMRASEANEESAAKEMVNSGISLVKVRCADFFAAKRGNQSKARLIRSLLQPLTVAITSTFAVINFGGEEEGEFGQDDALALLAAGNALATAGLNVYEDQFLFGAENVTSVEQMTMRALATHERAILKSVSSFDVGVRRLIDHQSICLPGNILELVRQSIDNGDFRARTTGVGVAPVVTSTEVDDESDAATIELNQPPIQPSDPT